MLGGEGGAADPQMPTIHVSEGGRWLRAWGADGGSWAGCLSVPHIPGLYFLFCSRAALASS